MTQTISSPIVYYPKSISELLSLYKTMPDSQLFAGGTEILSTKTTKYPVFSQNIICLSKIDELSAIRRSEGYIEIGACATLNKIIGIGEHVLKTALYKALNSIATKELRNLATIGGNICSPDRRKNLIPLLILLDTKLELRKQGTSRWLNLKRFLSESEGMAKDEILTKLRIPFNNYNHQFFTITGDLKFNYNDALSFTALASTQKDIITSIKFSAGYGNKKVFRSRDFEESLSGR
ncbi:MAG: FAD binding domain-containing protein, partial [Spirochaetales bacterium]|nr:FAD binding domain-containing protein [Spirochaetales bacterium]